MVKFLVIGDLHGRKPKIHFKDFDGIILIGDVCDDREIKKYYKEVFRAKKKNKNITNFERYIMNKIGEKKFDDMFKRSLKKGHETLKYLDSLGKPVFMVAGNWDQSYGPSRIKNVNKSRYNYLKYFLDELLGEKINPEITKGLRNVKNCMYKNYQFNGFNLYGYGLASATESRKLTSSPP